MEPIPNTSKMYVSQKGKVTEFDYHSMQVTKYNSFENQGNSTIVLTQVYNMKIIEPYIFILTTSSDVVILKDFCEVKRYTQAQLCQSGGDSGYSSIGKANQQLAQESHAALESMMAPSTASPNSNVWSKLAQRHQNLRRRSFSQKLQTSELMSREDYVFSFSMEW